MFYVQLTNHPLLLALPEQVDQIVLRNTALAIAEEALEGRADFAEVPPGEIAEGILNSVLSRMPDDVIEPLKAEEITGSSFRLTRPVAKEVVLEALAANPVAICVHSPRDMHIHQTPGFFPLGVPDERLHALAEHAANLAVSGDDPLGVTQHRWGHSMFLIWVGGAEDGLHAVFHVPEERAELLQILQRKFSDGESAHDDANVETRKAGKDKRNA